MVSFEGDKGPLFERPTEQKILELMDVEPRQIVAGDDEDETGDDVIDEVVVVGPSVSNLAKNYALKVGVYGCGGFGINHTRLLPQILKDYPSAEYVILDSSESNTHRQEVDPSIKQHLFDKDGRGKIRGNKIQIDQQMVDNYIYTELTEDPDVAICIFSLSGGTGSVIGPLVVTAFANKGIPVIVITVAEGSSTVDCGHTINALDSLERMTSRSNGYTNLILFDNTVNGQKAVDAIVPLKIKEIVRTMNLNHIISLDKNDITTALRPSKHKILANIKGVFCLRVVNGTSYDECYDNEPINIAHSSITIEGDDSFSAKPIPSTVNYSGSYTEAGSSTKLMMGLPIPASFVTKYDALVKKYETMSSAHVAKTTIEVKTAEVHDSGMVF